MNTIYTAGLFDGEGGLRINKSKQTRSPNPHYSLVVYLQLTQKDIITNLKLDWGGTVSPYKKPNSNWKDQWLWFICSEKAIHFIKAIYNYSIIKRPQIEVAMQFQSILHKNGYNKKLTVAELDERERYYLQMKQLNKRGK